MKLEQIAKDVNRQISDEGDYEERMVFARRLAERYGLERPELILLLTHPKGAGMTLSERCRQIGITEEEYFFHTTEDGFKEMMRDWETVQMRTVKSQAIDSASLALRAPRWIPTKFGDVADHGLEKELLRTVEAPQVNVQVNNNGTNVWTEARKIAGGGS